MTVNIKGKGYQGTISPKTTTLPNYTYTVEANGPYTFVIEDQYGNKIKKEIEVNNIDNMSPTGNCSAIIIGSNATIEVNAEDDKGISGYKYLLDSTSTDYISDSTYKTTSNAKKISVKVKDIVGNETTIPCVVEKKEETTVSGRSSGSAQVIDTSEYRLVATKNDVVSFARIVDNLRVAQNKPPGYGGECLWFAYYHAYNLYYGTNLNAMSAEEAHEHKYATYFSNFANDDKQVVLERLYEAINQGYPVVLHVNGNAAVTSRHFVTVVGYKKSVTSKESITEEDLLIIDAHNGKLERMDRESSRFMISGYDTGRTTYGYRILILK